MDANSYIKVKLKKSSSKLKTMQKTATQFKKDYKFEFDNYTYKLVTSELEIEKFNSLVFNNFNEALKLENRSKRYTDIVMASKTLDNSIERNTLRVIAYNSQNEVIATICTYLDGGRLPGEMKENCDYSELRGKCNIMELGRLSIRSDYRLKPLLTYGLIQFIIDVAIAKNVDVFIESAFTDKLNMFLRIGFQKFEKGNTFDVIYQIPKALCYYNFAAKVFGYFNPGSKRNVHQLSNYNKRIFDLTGEEKLLPAYLSLLELNSDKPISERTYNTDYVDFNLVK